MLQQQKIRRFFPRWFTIGVCLSVLLPASFAGAAEPRKVEKETSIHINKNVIVVSGRMSLGLINGKSNENVYVPEFQHKLSELNWDISGVYMLGLGGSVAPLSWLKLNGDVWFKLNKGDGSMRDYDWLFLGEQYTLYSRSDNLDVTRGIKVDVNSELTFYEYLKKHLDLSAKTAVVFAGYGDNAGEGFVLARLLSKDCFVFVFLYGETKKFSGDTSAAFTRIQGNDHVDVLRPDQIDAHTIKKIKATDHLLVIDALFGIGFSGQMPVKFTPAVDLFNSLPGYKVSLDVPSGVNAVTGEMSSFVCKPDLTLTLHEKKPGLMGLKNVTIVTLRR